MPGVFLINILRIEVHKERTYLTAIDMLATLFGFEVARDLFSKKAVIDMDAVSDITHQAVDTPNILVPVR